MMSSVDGTWRCLIVGDLRFHLQLACAWKMPRMPLEEGCQADWLLIRLLYLGKGGILSDGQDGLRVGLSSTLLSTRISSDPSNIRAVEHVITTHRLDHWT
jgi:hypothetical protein